MERMMVLVALLLVLEGLDAFVERAMKQFGSPGVSVGVISGGETLVAKGYGVRSQSGGQPVTADTTFAIGSVTKSFTSLALATLVDEGKLDWDKPVRDYLPWFRLHDPVATDLITVRDMLSHRSGLPRYDSMRFLVQFPREELVRRLRYLPPTRTFRDVFQYNNLMFVAAGYLGGHLAGTTWEEMIQQRIFVPLEMKSSTVAVTEMQKGSDFAKPHNPREVPFYDYQQFGVGPNGAVNSSVNDMLRYARFFLDDGIVNGKRLLSVTQMRELWKPVTVAAGSSTYALGWYVGNRGGHRQVGHGGAITGFTANLLLIPDKKIAVVVLNNAPTPLPDVVSEYIADELLGLPRKDRLEELAKRMAERGSGPSGPAAVAGTKPSHALSAFAGEYSHPAYGSLRIVEKDGSLAVVTPVTTVALRHHHYDVFAASGPIGGLIVFETAPDGAIGRMLLPVDAAAEPLPFVRVR
jgi:CubicO group peptidase (beta-lactamase class C family)